MSLRKPYDDHALGLSWVLRDPPHLAWVARLAALFLCYIFRMAKLSEILKSRAY